MKALKKDLQSVIKTLKALTKKTEQLEKALEKIESPSTPQKRAVNKAVKRTGARKKTGNTAADTVFGFIKRSRNGINTAALEKKTNFDAVKVRNIVFRLKKQGKIRSKSRGIYEAI